MLNNLFLAHSSLRNVGYHEKKITTYQWIVNQSIVNQLMFNKLIDKMHPFTIFSFPIKCHQGSHTCKFPLDCRKLCMKNCCDGTQISGFTVDMPRGYVCSHCPSCVPCILLWPVAGLTVWLHVKYLNLTGGQNCWTTSIVKGNWRGPDRKKTHLHSVKWMSHQNTSST